MVNDLKKVCLSLLNSALTGQPTVLDEEVDWSQLYKLAKRHHIVNLLSEGLFRANISTDDERLEPFYCSSCNELMRSERQMKELAKLFAMFEKNGIDYIPLKGTVLKSLYPSPEMRTMGDADILIRFEQYEQIRPLMLELGFVSVEENEHDLVWEKKNALYLELHKRLIPTYVVDYTAIGSGWETATRVSEDTHRYAMRAEDEYLFLFVHLAKHYRHGGVGIKQMTDLFVYQQAHSDLDKQYIADKLKEMSLYEFYGNITETLATWFDNAPTTPKTDFITEIIFKSGAFGTVEQTVLSGAVKNAKKNEGVSYSRIRFNSFLNALFLPYKDMCEKYAFLKKMPILLPAMWVYRWIVSLVWKRRNITQAIKNVQELTPDHIETHRQSLQYVGLDFSFEE